MCRISAFSSPDIHAMNPSKNFRKELLAFSVLKGDLMIVVLGTQSSTEFVLIQDLL